jgi:two-component system NtrC family sensor kinase
VTVRLRIAIGFMAIILVANSILYFITVRHISRVFLQEVQTRVRLDLNAAWMVYNNRLESIEQLLRTVSLDKSIAHAVKANDRSQLARLLDAAHEESQIDMLSLVGLDGKVIYRTTNPTQRGDDASNNLLIARALEQQKPVSGTVIVPREYLERESQSLADRAYFKILPTPAARPTSKKLETSGMVIGSALFVTDDEGKKVALLYGGNLLNRRYRIVDSIKDVVFRDQTYEGKDIGTSTIFQDDLRISTNVRNKDGSRAIGTLLSAAVAEKVLQRGENWTDRAFVVNNWYITAYAPIRDVENRIIGILYVGLLEEPFVHPQKVAVNLFLLLVAVMTLVILSLLLLLTNVVLRPITQIIAMSNKVIRGDLSARVGISPTGEMGDLCRAIDQMAHAVEEREQQLKSATSRQLGQSAKLASIGRLAAGIAHEINNPLTGVLTFAHLLRQKTTMDEQSKEDIDVIVRETTRVREIVQGLLNFARESPPQKQLLDINEVLSQAMTLVRSQKEFRNITVEEKLASNLPYILGDKNQLQQVFLNLSLNACEAMEKGGTLSIATSFRDGNVIISFRDTGCGIRKEHVERIFDPFFTTKPVGKGTGLGLSVSYGIIEQHGGSIEVESEEGKGSTFTITLPVESSEAQKDMQKGTTHG